MYGGRVIGGAPYRGMGGGDVLGEDSGAGDQCCQFEMAICEVPMRVGGGDEAVG